MPSDPVVNPDVLAVRSYIAKDPIKGWDEAWRANVTPWDSGAVQPPLHELIESGELDLPRKGRALVPGCGRGYDVIYIASSLGLNTLAVDISTTAIQAAKELLASSPEVPSGGIYFQEADFFTFQVPNDEKFDLAYDYTFFVAIPPSRRGDWGKQMTSLLKPGGYLITLVWPLDLPLEGGPPFHVKPEHYVAVLGDNWEKVLDKVPKNSSEKHEGRERLIVWRRK